MPHGSTYQDTQPLTVWRRLWVERDVAPWTGLASDPNPGSLEFKYDSRKTPIDGFVETQLARACIKIEEYLDNSYRGPMTSSPITIGDLVDIVVDEIGRELKKEWNSNDYWTIRIVTISAFSWDVAEALSGIARPSDVTPWDFVPANGNFISGTNTILIAYAYMNTRHQSSEDLQQAMRQTVLHELGHALGIISEGNDGVMKSFLSVAEELQPQYQQFLDGDIVTIQEESKTRD